MKKEKSEEKTKKSIWKKIILVVTVISLLASFYSIYNILLLGPIEPLIRYIFVGILGFIDLILLLKTRKIWKGKYKNKEKKRQHILFFLFMIIYIAINIIIGMIIGNVYGSLNNMNKQYITYSTSLVTMKDSKIEDINNVEDLTLGLINDSSSTEGYIISQEIIKEQKLSEKNDIENYDDYTLMMKDLYEGKIDALFISSNYTTMFQGIEEFSNISEETKVIYKKEKKMKKASRNSSSLGTGKKITEPFTVLLMGIDSEVDGLDKNGVANGDALILVTFNPKTLNVTMLSIPRDTYVPIACVRNNAENKITHAAWYGETCMIQTIEDFTGIPIDYYAKINFKGVVSLVDALGGIDVEVPQDLCTDDSNRGKQVCINAGNQHLNGEEALVLSRNRKALANGDIGRGLNQQIVIQGMINKIKNIRSVDTMMDILNAVSKNMDTNFTTEQILSFYNIAKDIVTRSLSKEDGEVVNIQQLYLQGSGQMIYDEGMKMSLWNYIPNEDSLEDIIEAMEENLELKEHKLIKTFSFSINEPYEKEVIGMDNYNIGSDYTLLPDFTGDTRAQAQSWANANGLKISFEEVETNDYKDGIVFDQSQPAKKRLDKISGTVILKIAKNTTSKDNTKDEDNNTEIDCGSSKNSKNQSCLVPDFSTMTKSQINTWVTPLKGVLITYENVTLPGATPGTIVSQSVKQGTYLGSTKSIVLGIATEDNSDDEEITDDDNEQKEMPDE